MSDERLAEIRERLQAGTGLGAFHQAKQLLDEVDRCRAVLTEIGKGLPHQIDGKGVPASAIARAALEAR